MITREISAPHRDSVTCSFVILDGTAEGMAGYFEGFDLDKNERVTLKEVG